jgi:hypothetical protein
VLPQVSTSLVTPNNLAGIEWVEIPVGDFLFGERNESKHITKSLDSGDFRPVSLN